MEHRKIYHSLTVQAAGDGPEIVVEGPVTPEHLQTLEMNQDLDSFRRPRDQLEALIEIAGLPEGRIIISRSENTIVGYVTFHYPDPIERWSEGNMKDLIELGAIEMADDYRGLGLGKKMIQLAFSDEQLENVITFTTEYYWHWDLDKTGLGVWDYRKMMEKLMKSVDMEWCATDDPEICSHPANCLMVRIGKDVPLTSVEQFDHIRFQRRFMY